MRNVEVTTSGPAGAARQRTSDRKRTLGRIEASAKWPFLSDQTRSERLLALRNNRRLVWGLVLLIATLATAFGVIGATTGFGFGANTALFVLLALPLPCIWIFERLRRTTAVDDSWVVEQPEESEFLVEMLVEVNGVVMGSDRGVAWFEPSAVCFTGQRSWFRIGYEHIHEDPVGEGPSAQFNEMNAGRTTMRIRYADARVRIKLIDGGTPGGDGALRLALQMADIPILRHTRLSATSSEQTTLPPLTIDPEYRHDIFHNTELSTNAYIALLLLPVVIQARSPLEIIFIVLVGIAAALNKPLRRLLQPAIFRARAARKAQFEQLL